MSGYPDATKIYESNLRLAGAPALVQSDILPSVKKVVAIEGDNVVLEGKAPLFAVYQPANVYPLLAGVGSAP